MNPQLEMFQYEHSGWLKVQALFVLLLWEFTTTSVASPYNIPKILTLRKEGKFTDWEWEWNRYHELDRWEANKNRLPMLWGVPFVESQARSSKGFLVEHRVVFELK